MKYGSLLPLHPLLSLIPRPSLPYFHPILSFLTALLFDPALPPPLPWFVLYNVVLDLALRVPVVGPGEADGGGLDVRHTDLGGGPGQR